MKIALATVALAAIAALLVFGRGAVDVGVMILIIGPALFGAAGFLVMIVYVIWRLVDERGDARVASRIARRAREAQK